MSASFIEQRLRAAEEHFHALSHALRENDFDAVHRHSTGLQALTVDLAQTLQKQVSAELNKKQLGTKVTQLAREISLLHANLLRRSAQVERMLHVLIPNSAHTTYTASTPPYATVIRQSGQFKALYA